MTPRLFVACFLLGIFSTSCISSSAERGVPPNWNEAGVDFERGVTTRRDVLDALGPPSQILTSTSGTAFYYLLERTDTKGLVLLVYNTRSEKTVYDRAVFFFDGEGVLEEWSSRIAGED